MIYENRTRNVNIDKIPKYLKNNQDYLYRIIILKNKIQNEWLRLRNQYEK